MEEENIEVKIHMLIDKLRPFLISDGGNIVYVRLLGACENCSMMDITLKDGIEQLIINEIPEVEEVRRID